MLGCQVDARGLDAPPEARRPLDTELDANAALATTERVNVSWMLGCQVDTGGLDAPPEARRPLDTKLDANAALATMERVNDAFMAKWPSPGDAIVVKREVLPGNSWSRAVYFEGLMALAAVDPKPAYDDYAEAWAESHAWQLGAASTTPTRFADDQCAAQTYLELHARRPEDGARIAAVEASVDAMVTSTKVDDWTWIDAIQMAMPVFARLGTLRGDARIFDKMNALYTYARDTAGGHGLYDPDAHLWWRDAKFTPPYAEPNGASCYWARGNGWVYAGLARVLDVLPRDEPHRAAYEADFVAMSESLRTLRRDDGFWNVSLHDPTHFGGKELSGTSLFVYGMAWGIRHGLLSETVYRPLVVGSWNAMVTEAVHPDGVLGYAQGRAAGPSDGQPVTRDSTPNLDDFGVGCFLLAGSAVVGLAGRSATGDYPVASGGGCAGSVGSPALRR